MAACGRLQHIFDTPLPDSPTLLESLSPWKGIKNINPIGNSTFAEIFGQLHFKEDVQDDCSFSSSSSALSSSSSSSSSSTSSLSLALDQTGGNSDDITQSPKRNDAQKKLYEHSDSFSSINSESLTLCTEGLGLESSDDVDESGNETCIHFQEENTCYTTRYSGYENLHKESNRSRRNRDSFPPPISSIGRTGKPWVCFRSYRQDGRFILQEIKFPAQEFLHACREGGRLRLQLIQSDDELQEEDEDEEEEEDDVNETVDAETCYIETQDVNEETVVDYDADHENQSTTEKP